jgi:hypothetical protein
VYEDLPSDGIGVSTLVLRLGSEGVTVDAEIVEMAGTASVPPWVNVPVIRVLGFLSNALQVKIITYE